MNLSSNVHLRFLGWSHLILMYKKERVSHLKYNDTPKWPTITRNRELIFCWWKYFFTFLITTDAYKNEHKDLNIFIKSIFY